MQKSFTITQIVPYFIILILFFIIFQMYQNGKNEVEFNKRNDSLETVNKQFESKIQRLNLDLTELKQSIAVNEAGTEQQRKIYIKERERILKQPYNKDYEELKELLK